MALVVIYSLLIVTIHNILCQALTCPKSADCGPCGSSSQSCTLDCIGRDYCYGDTVALRCEPGVPCILNCYGSFTCTDSRLISNGATSVTIICQGFYACSGGVRFNCEPGVPCHVECDVDNCDSLHVNVNGASPFSCNNCPPTATDPIIAPTPDPTVAPTNDPTPTPITKNPTPAPTNNPTPTPTNNPTSKPTKNPTPTPTNNPTPTPTDNPTPTPTNNPTPTPTNNPTPAPTKKSNANTYR